MYIISYFLVIFFFFFDIMHLMKKRRMIILFSILAFIMVLVLLNSVVFSIREVRAACFNSNDQKLMDRVVSASGIEPYKNIIILNEKKAIDNINGEMGDEVKVVNIERKFPDKVWIHFVKLVPVLAIEKSDGYYVTCDNNLDLIETDAPASSFLFDASVKEVDENTDGGKRPIVRALIKGGVVNPEAKSALTLSDANALLGLRTVVDTINRLDYAEYDFVRLLKEIDFRDYNDTVNPVIEFKMRDGGPKSITITIENTKKFLLQKVQHAISAYEQYLAGELNFSKNEWTVYNNSKNEIIIAG